MYYLVEFAYYDEDDHDHMLDYVEFPTLNEAHNFVEIEGLTIPDFQLVDISLVEGDIYVPPPNSGYGG